MKKLTDKQVESFRKEVWGYYKKYGRDLPWRRTRNPYRILVSEIMLQQTQVSRVVEKYKEFLRAFPTIQALARAKTSDVLSVWQGLGYNRRALSLKNTAQRVVDEYGGKIPKDPYILMSFPGIGEATSASICAFAFNMPTVFVETNIRSVFIHTFFPIKARNTRMIHDKEILPLIEQTCDTKNPREWYFALMDYGVSLKKEGNPSRYSAHYTKQAPFKTSNRYIRGQIIKNLTEHKKLTLPQMKTIINKDKKRIETCLNDLIAEGFLVKNKNNYLLEN